MVTMGYRRLWKCLCVWSWWYCVLVQMATSGFGLEVVSFDSLLWSNTWPYLIIVCIVLLFVPPAQRCLVSRPVDEAYLKQFMWIEHVSFFWGAGMIQNSWPFSGDVRDRIDKIPSYNVIGRNPISHQNSSSHLDILTHMLLECLQWQETHLSKISFSFWEALITWNFFFSSPSQDPLTQSILHLGELSPSLVSNLLKNRNSVLVAMLGWDPRPSDSWSNACSFPHVKLPPSIWLLR